MMFCVDQEGGRVVRLRAPLTALPPARRLGETDDESLTEAAGRLVGLELASVGFNLDFAPVLDVDTHPNSPVIGDRSFGRTTGPVLKHGIAFGAGLSKAGVSPCAKHFPGHGDAALDSHLKLPMVAHDRERLDEVELLPFTKWVASGLGPIMTAHVVYPALDPDNPATLSMPIVNGVLRQSMGFGGVVFTDDLEMGAITDYGGTAPAAVRSVRASVDGLLVCRQADLQEEVLERLTREAENDEDFEAMLKASAARIDTLCNKWNKTATFGWLGSSAHERLRSEVLSRLGDNKS